VIASVKANAGPQTPVAAITSSPSLVASVDVPYTYVIAVTGSPVPVITVTGLPAWLSFNDVDTISGTPSAGDVGLTGTITVTATNSEGTDQQMFQLTVTDVDPALVAWYRFDESAGSSAADSSPNSNPGTLVGFPTDDSQWVAGRIGGALAFDGSDDHVDCGNTASLDAVQTGGAITIAAWVALSGGNSYPMIVTRGNSLLEFRFEGTTRQLQLAAGGWTLAGPADAVSAGEWHHVAGTFDDATDTQRLYVDGSVVKEDTGVTGAMTHAGNTLYVGRREDGYYFDGVIDDLRIYDRALSAAEIAGLHGLGDAAAPSITSFAPDTATVGVPYVYTITATGNPAPTFSVGGNPSWLTLSGSALSGTPTVSDVGTTGTITVTATNSEGSDQQTFQIEVVAGPNGPPTASITSPADGDYLAFGDAILFSCAATDPDGDPMTYTWTSSLDGQIGTTASFITGVLTRGTHTVTVTVSDGENAPVTLCVTINVILDDDHDGMDDDWELLYDPGSGDLDPTEDTDGDDHTNLQEFRAGTDPTDPASYPGASAGFSSTGCAAGPEGIGAAWPWFAAALVFSFVKRRGSHWMRSRRQRGPMR
jgi:uncharacterized protein (TIGR03382 family)